MLTRLDPHIRPLNEAFHLLLSNVQMLNKYYNLLFFFLKKKSTCVYGIKRVVTDIYREKLDKAHLAEYRRRKITGTFVLYFRSSMAQFWISRPTKSLV